MATGISGSATPAAFTKALNISPLNTTLRILTYVSSLGTLETHWGAGQANRNTPSLRHIQMEFVMIISDALLDRVNEDPINVCLEVCQLANALSNRSDSNIQLEACLFLGTVIDGGLLDYQGDIPRPEDGQIHRAIAANFFATVQSQIEALIKRESAISLQRGFESRFKQIIKSGFGYDFSEADVSRVQTLINELRTLLTADSSLDDDHKRRLLIRLEKLQKELHKRVSDLSNFYNLMGDAGVALGKLGKDAKPLVDRITEILQIGWKAQARAEKLPSSADNPMIGHDGEVPKLE